MIVFNLSCNNDHRFEGWFESSAKFESQRDARQVSCPVCGTDQISKELHAPYVNTGAGRAAESPSRTVTPEQPMAVMNKAVARFVEQGGTLVVEAKPDPPFALERVGYLMTPGPDLVTTLGISARLSR